MAQATRRRKAAGEAATRGTVRLNVALPTETWQRLVLHATMSGETQAAIITELVETHLRSYRVQFIGPKESVRPDESAPVAPPEVSAAAAL